MKNMMMFFLIIIFSLPVHLQVLGQDYLWEDKETIIQEYESYIDINFQLTIIDSTDKVIVNISGSDRLDIVYHLKSNQESIFNHKSICDSIVINIICEACVEFHISEILNSKERKWKKHSDSLYVSSKWLSKFMPKNKKSPNTYIVPVLKLTNEQHITKINLFTKELTKRNWKSLIDKRN